MDDKTREISDPLRSHDARLTYISYDPGHHEPEPPLSSPSAERTMPRVSEWSDYPPIRNEWAFQDQPRPDNSRSPHDNDLTTPHPLRVTPLTIYPPPPHHYELNPQTTSQQLSNDDEQSVQGKKFKADNVFRMPTPSMRDCVVAMAACFCVAFLLTIFVAVYFGNNSEPQ